MLFFLKQGFSVTQKLVTENVGLTGWPANPQNCPVLPIAFTVLCQQLGLQACATHRPGFYMSAGASQAGLTAHTQTLPR